ncbi:VOC family protein [Amycolatopsis jejuensis]|uniref:VOC family protein n=1 Tax=Amycolatopsis jejuensis TaxID=330084 RepID=UPI0005269323|nr:VOC family protein [Amycolatopsis jejuensis]
MDDKLPLRLHHHAWTVDDQEATRYFYEDLIGLPLLATWTEVEEILGKERVLCHTFYGMADGSALAFFQFADPEDQKEFTRDRQIVPDTLPRSHVAFKVDQETQEGIQKRLTAVGWKDSFVTDHGYCVSLYVTDPDGLMVEFAVDHPAIEEINAERRETAHADLARWLRGDHTSNNHWRSTEASWG